MTIFNKPENVNNVWASDGDKVYAGDAKTGIGWIEEIPPHENFNFIDYKQDQFIAHVNQYGIAEWDKDTQYIANKSVTLASDGLWYRAKITNVDQDPTDSPEGYWERVPMSLDDPTSLKRYIGYQLYASNFTALVNRRYYLTTPITVTLPAEHTAGDVVTFAKSPTITATIAATVPDKIVTSLGAYDNATFDFNDEINFVSNGTSWEV